MATACNPESSIFSEILETKASRQTNSLNTLYKEIPVDDYDSSNTTPVFYGRFPRRIEDILDTDITHFSSHSQRKSTQNTVHDTAVVHPATFGYVLLDKMPVVQNVKERLKPLPDPQKCCPREYLESYIFPILLPALEEMLVKAKNNKVFEKRRTKFNACDFLTTYLYSHNPKYEDRKDDICLEEIPCVQEILSVNPRPPIPLSLLLSDDEAATIIQSHYRGYQVRKEPEVQELREYQRDMREEQVDINSRVNDFWRKHSMENVE